MNRRAFLSMTGGAALQASRRPVPAQMKCKWVIDPRCVLPRGASGSIDSKIAGDPCVVWDEDYNTFRMFYFASSAGDPNPQRAQALVAGMALSRSAEEIGPGDWEKVGQVSLKNQDGLLQGYPGHKWWVIMDPFRLNRAAPIQDRYWALFVSTNGIKHIQAAHAEKLAGPWTVIAQPILSPGEVGAPDGKHCDTPTGYFFPPDVLIFYKGYPALAQKNQPGSPFGSSSIVAYWKPGAEPARKGLQILVPGRDKCWNSGWIGGLQLLHDSTAGWYALNNGSPTPPQDRSNREPAPSMGGWLRCSNRSPQTGWSTDTSVSPFLYPDQLSSAQLKAGMGVNFWRHHLVVTPRRRRRIFFNSGRYGTEQMYSLEAVA